MLLPFTFRHILRGYVPFLAPYTIRPYPVNLQQHWYLVWAQVFQLQENSDFYTGIADLPTFIIALLCHYCVCLWNNPNLINHNIAMYEFSEINYAVFRFRIRIHMFLGLLDPDPFVRGRIRIRLRIRLRIRILLSSCKNSKKNLGSFYFVSLFDFLSLKNDVNVASKSNKQNKLC